MDVRFYKNWQMVVMSVVCCGLVSTELLAQGVVPGQGRVIPKVGDNFEDPKWKYTLNLPKSSSNIDERVRRPNAYSSNRRVLESDYRGTPDVVERVPTPPGGLPGSTGALLIQTKNAGIPGRLSYEMQQDDLILNPRGASRSEFSLHKNPSFVVRVYIPDFDEWENRVGSSFGIRADCHTYTMKKPKGLGIFGALAGRRKEREPYWPGFFLQFNSKTDRRFEEDSATILIRGDQNGHEVAGPKITQPGWWTFGMSFTPDGRVHYYASEGIDDLTVNDHLYSSFPYGYKCEGFHSCFFNVTSMDNGNTWSTPWVVDDPTFYNTASPIPTRSANASGRRYK